MDGDLLRVRWDIADGYYLYRVKFDISPESPDLTLDPAQFPPGASRTDAYFGTQEIFRQQVETLVGFKRSDAGAHPIQIKVSYQGCADAGLCYPLIVKVLSPEAAPRPAQTVVPVSAAQASARQSAHSPATDEDIPMLGSLVGAIAFFLAGLGLRGNRTA